MRWKHVLSAVVVLLLVGLLPSAAHGQSESRRPAADTVAGCLDRTGRLEILFLVDESASLRGFGNTPGTDPDDLRVGAIKAALAGLSRTADAPLDGRELHIDVKLVAFGSGYNPVTPDWRRLDGGSLDELLGVADRFADLDAGLDTDYGTALLRARDDLAARSAAVTADGADAPCLALVFFTDGKYDIGDRTGGSRASLPDRVDYSDAPLNEVGGGARAVEDGRRFLCAEGGLGDQLRASGVATFTVALDVGLDAASRDFLDALTDGSGGTATCGTTGSEATGLFVSAAQADDLLDVFGNLLGPPRERVFCAEQQRCTFEVFEGLSGFSLLTSAPADGLELVLTSPEGASVRIDADAPRTIDLNGTELEQRRLSERASDVVGRLGSGAGVGEWQLGFADPSGEAVSGGSFSIQYRSEILADVGDLPPIRRGEPTVIPLRFVDPSGDPITGGPLLSGATIEASVVDPVTGEETALVVERVGTGQFEAEYAPPSDLESSTVRLDLSASVQPQEGIELVVPPRSIELTVLPPATFPRIEPGQLQMPSIVDGGSSTATLTLVGSEEADGCVFFERSTMVLPSGDSTPVALSPSATSASDCLSVPRGQTRLVEVDIDAEDADRGRGRGEITAVLIGPDDEPPQRIVIPLSVDLDVSPDAGVGWLVFAALMLAAIAIPLLALHLLNHVSALIRPVPQTVRMRSYTVRVLEDRVIDVDTGQRPDTDYTEFRPARAGTSRPVRELDLGTVALRTRATWDRALRRFSLFSGPFAVATAGGRPLIAGNAGTALQASDDHRSHEVPLALPGTWVFVRTDDGMGSPEGALILLIHHTAYDSASALVDDVDRSLPARVAALRGAAVAPPSTADNGQPEDGSAWSDPPQLPDDGSSLRY